MKLANPVSPGKHR